MTYRRAVALVLAVVAVATWLAITTGRGFAPVERSAPRPLVTSSPLDPAIRNVQGQAGRLRAYLASAPPLAQAARNPFRFRERPEARPAPALSTAAASVLAAVTARPQLVLSGLAEDPSPSGPVRTAIISGLGQLFLVKEGEEFGGRFQAVRIGTNAVQVLDRSDGSTFTLALR